MAFGTVIVGGQRIYLCNARHSRHEGRPHRSPGSHQVSVIIGFPHQLLGDDIHHRKAVGNNGIQLLLQTGSNHFRQLFPIDGMRLLVTDIPEGLIGIFNHGRTLIRPHRGNVLNHICDLIGICNHHLLCLVAAQVFELREHLFRSPQVQRRLVICILKSFPRHNNPAVDLILRI